MKLARCGHASILCALVLSALLFQSQSPARADAPPSNQNNASLASTESWITNTLEQQYTPGSAYQYKSVYWNGPILTYTQISGPGTSSQKTINVEIDLSKNIKASWDGYGLEIQVVGESYTGDGSITVKEHGYDLHPGQSSVATPANIMVFLKGYPYGIGNPRNQNIDFANAINHAHNLLRSD